MQDLLVDLYPWLVAFWLLDAVVEPRRGHLLVLAGPGRARLARAGLQLAGLSPLCEIVALHDLPWLASRGRLWVRDPGRGPDRALVGPGDLEATDAAALGATARVGRKLVVGGRTLLVAPTPGWAEALRVRLAAWGEAATGAGGGADRRAAAAAARRTRAPGPREPDVAAEVATDVAAARALRDRQRPFLLAIRILAALLAAGALAVWPAVAWLPELCPVPAGVLLAVLGALVFAIGVLGATMLRACGEGWSASLGAGLHLVLYPVAALRPLAHLSRSLYRRLEPAAALAVLLAPPALAAYGALELARARVSGAATGPELMPAWQERSARVAGALEAAGLSAAEVVSAPRPEAGAVSWCALCRAQYRAGFETCADCGVAVEPFGTGPSTRAEA